MIYKDKTGLIVNNVKILRLDEDKTSKFKKAYWIYNCPICGKEKSARFDRVGSKCRSCANKQNRSHATNPKITLDLTGQYFGFWKVLKKSQKANYWYCKCMNCGTERDVFRGNLTSGNSKSCGCISSWGEQQLLFLLNKYNINFISQYSFKDLKLKSKLRFDFAVFDNNNNLFCLIEYDGRQHFSFDENWKMSKEDYLYLQKSDNLKNNYCLKNNILLFRFNQNDNLETKIIKIKEKINNEINKFKSI